MGTKRGLTEVCFVEQIHTSKMTLADDVNLEEFVMSKDEFSGADIKAICTEAGLLALRERRMKVRQHCRPNRDPLVVSLEKHTYLAYLVDTCSWHFANATPLFHQRFLYL
jgi:SpoVK/Ycf46/Vps4 family AAA+-type ATPase